MFEYFEHLMYGYHDLYGYIRPSFGGRVTQFVGWLTPLAQKDLIVSMICLPHSQYLLYITYHIAIRPLIIDPENLGF